MAINRVRTNFSYLFFILNLSIFSFSFLIMGKEIKFKSFILIILSFVLYYIVNIFNMNGVNYRFPDFLKTVMLNSVLVFVSVFSNIFMLEEAIVVFGMVMIFQIIYKYIVITEFVEKLKVIFIGQNRYTMDLKKDLIKDANYNLVGIYNENTENIQEILTQEYERIRPDVIVDFTETLLKDKKIVDQLLSYKLKGLQYYDYIDFYEKFEYKLPVYDLDHKWFLANHGFEIYYNNFNLKLKRICDFFFSIVLGVLTAPLMLISALIIKVESKGPVLFMQERIGEGNKPFNIIKFRSMRTDAEKDGPQWASKNDNRITKFGKFIRLTRIDELPQLWNVIKGEMSFVGPRPEREFFIEQLEKEMPYYNFRHTVKPGLTGWAQIMYPYGASVEDAYNKLQYDLYYIKNHNIMLDIVVLLKTLKIVFFGKGR